MNDLPRIRNYNEEELARRLSILTPRARVSFACACAERLIPAYRWFCDTTGVGNFELIREALDVAWTCNTTGQMSELDHVRETVTNANPSDDDSGEFAGAAVAQNAVACVYYVIEVCLTGNVQASIWAARQLYEAADTVVQQGAATQTFVMDIGRERPVRMMVEGIVAALADAGGVDDTELRAKAEEDGWEFLAILTGCT